MFGKVDVLVDEVDGFKMKIEFDGKQIRDLDRNDFDACEGR